MREAGLEVEVDAARNAGGKFDGALGVVAAIEAVERAGAGAVVAFRDEETGCGGSTAFVQGGDLPACFLELHIEQGPVLERAGVPLGLVTGITGLARGERVFEGEAGHAGTVPMTVRRDALVAAAEYVVRVQEVAAGIEGAVATVGQLELEPGAANVIPSRARLSVDARAPDAERLDRLVSELELEPFFRLEPVAMADDPRAALRAEVESRALAVVELGSGAGHDAAILAEAGVPTAMLFVRSLNGGVSHSPDEHSSAEDVALAVEVLTGALTRLASRRD